MTSPSVELFLVAGRAVFLVFSFILAALAFTAWRRSSQAQTSQLLAQTNTILQRLAALEARLDATKVALSQLGERLEHSPPPPASTAGSGTPGYQIAIRLAKGGASPEELMSGCGLSLSEAELVHRLHGPNDSPRGQKPRFLPAAKLCDGPHSAETASRPVSANE